ncbi:MAG: AAA family ATPase [Rhodoferax sp.]|nr:AAA family ATPase [Rhodoferax sp.]
MPDTHANDPYHGNILTAGLGPLRSRLEVMQQLMERPKVPKSLAGIAPHVALHHLMSVRDFHIPSIEECRLHETIDLMMRQNYRYLDPVSAQTWSTISGEPSRPKRRQAPGYGAAVEGISGTGKTEAIRRCLESYPYQVVHHEAFPRLQGGHRQVVWLSVEVPASGRSVDLAVALMRAWDKATGGSRFATSIQKERRDGMKMLDEWQQVASAHFLGILHLDEIQNFFKLAALKKRGKRSGLGDAPELSIVEDQVLKWILTLINTWQVPLLVSGTPDGIGALTRRLSNTERIVTSGYHPFHHFDSASDPEFRKHFLDKLGPYQYVSKKLPVTDELAVLVIELTGGIQRLVIALWIAAQRVALERNSGELRLDDFKKAAATFLAPVAPAVAAFRSKDPARMSKYEDLLPRDGAFWAQFWSSVSRV